MKINLHQLNSFVDLKVDQDELLHRINTQLGEIQSVVDLGQKYAGAVIVKVVDVSAHPDGDKLSVCLIDDKQKIAKVERQTGGFVQVVCGAPNVKAGMLAVWLIPDSIVPNSFDQPPEKRIKLLPREIREVLSQGMLASPFELDLSADKETILAIEARPEYKAKDVNVEISADSVGCSFAETFHLNTSVIDIENKMFTHRPDCFGLIGLAREIAAITDSPFNDLGVYSHSLKPATEDSQNFKLNLDIQCPELVVRLQAHIIPNLKVEPSFNIYKQALLASLGFKSINNVVDETNLAMYLSGQPTHAFDYDKLLTHSLDAKKTLSLVVRQTRVGEELILLNGKMLTFDQPAIVIATDKQPVALGGIMGGLNTEVDEKTQTVLLECANFNMYNLRRTTMYYGVFSEAATRFTKGQSPQQIPPVAGLTSTLIARLSPAKNPSSDIEVYEFDATASQPEAPPLQTSAGFINERLGSSISAEAIATLLKKVEFKVNLLGQEVLEIEAPFWRTDIEIAEDIVEEIGRLNGGYQSLTPVLPVRFINAPASDAWLDLKSALRHVLATRGANEVMGYSFVASSFLKSANQDPADSFHLANPLNPSLEAYRQSLTPSLMKMTVANRRAGEKDFAFFEISPVHLKDQKWLDDEGLPLDLQRAAFVCHQTTSNNGSPFYLARRYLDLIARELQLDFIYESPKGELGLEASLLSVYDLKRSALVKVDSKSLGVIGLLDKAGTAAGWEIDLASLLEFQMQRKQISDYRAIAKYPKSSQDLTLQVPLLMPFGQIQATLEEVLKPYEDQGWQTDMGLLSIFQPPDKTDVKNISFRLTAGHSQKTVRKEEISDILQALIETARQKLKAKQVV